MKNRHLSLLDKLSIVAGKISARAIRMLGVGLGSNLPGRMARSVSPSVLAHLAEQCQLGVIAVSGTNGKSTTSGLIYSIFREAGLKTVHNRQGANLVTGITATLIEAAQWNGQLNADYCLFEVDEASLPVVAAETDFACVVVTNLFRDQLDRFGELDTTARLINKGINKNSSFAILNADDPNVAQLAAQSKRLYYGIESLTQGSETQSVSGTIELAYCPQCESEYKYSLVFYGQLGHYACPNCSHKRPIPDVAALDVQIAPNGSSFTLKLGQRHVSVHLPLPGFFNVYNAVAAAAVAHWLGIADLTIKAGLSHYATLFGRSEKLLVNGKAVIIQLIKNPAGASQVVASVARDPQARVLIAINDNLADGRDISWLWDADFELLADGHSKEIVVSGQRAYDMSVRMKYAGYTQEAITTMPSLEKALQYALAKTEAGETLWILPTYTCLLSLQKIFKSMGLSLSGT